MDDVIAWLKQEYKSIFEDVEDSGPAIHYDDDKAVRTTPWIEVVSKKNRRPDAFRNEYIRSGTLMDKQK
jgi:hypothetical protein